MCFWRCVERFWKKFISAIIEVVSKVNSFNDKGTLQHASWANLLGETPARIWSVFVILWYQFKLIGHGVERVGLSVRPQAEPVGVDMQLDCNSIS